MTNVMADLDIEVRRLRLRIIALMPRHLAEAGEWTPGQSRRETIAEALAQFSVIGSGARPVPELGDQSLSDQVVVLLEQGMRTATDLPEDEGEDILLRLLDAAVLLRRNLA